jgi:penicillin-binding protein 2
MTQMPAERSPDHSEIPTLVRDDTKFSVPKIVFVQYLAVGIFVFLLSGYWDLQVRNEEVYNELAERNQIKSLPVPAPRGRILDRDGRVIVDNHASYSLILARETLKEEHLPFIAQGLNIDPEELRQRVRRFATRPKYEPIYIKEELSSAELSFIEANRGLDAFPEMELIPSQQRVYPREGFLAHLLGYVGEIGEPELNSTEWAKHNPGDIIGKMGIERQYNEILTGKDGQRQVRVDNMGNEREVLQMKESEPGKDLTLTIDLDLQAVAELAMEGRNGAVVALNPRNGEVLAMVSRPAFDPNHFTGRISSREWNKLLTDPDKPLINRAIQAQFAPGSTFKPIMTLAGLETGTLDPTFSVTCPGSAVFYGRSFKCHAVHGHADLHRAIVQSCDVFFYTLGNKLGIDNIAKYAEMCGLGRKTGIDLPHEAEGVVPSSKWKIRNFREKWYAGETISVSIGQGALTITPIQLANAIGGIVAGGVWSTPHLVKDFAPERARKEVINIDSVNTIVYGMYGVVNEGGTAARAHLADLQICGKTGSSQRLSNDLAKANKELAQSMPDNAWFVGFAQREEPEIVVSVLFEGGKHGNFAAPIARDVIKAYFDKKARTAPPPPKPVAQLFQLAAPASVMGAKR